jgi:hypothetical protein
VNWVAVWGVAMGFDVLAAFALPGDPVPYLAAAIHFAAFVIARRNL